MHRGIARWLAAALLVLVPAAAAQSGRDAVILAELDAAIGFASPADSLTPDDGVAAEIATGLRELASYVERGDRDAVERALFRFNRATTRRQEWGWPEYAMAHAFLLLHDYGAPVINSTGARLGEGYYPAMERHLMEALRRDPGLGRARRLFLDLLLPAGARLLPPEVAAVLETEVSSPEPLADALLAWARHKRNTGSPQVALPILARAEAAGADPSLVALERARVQAELGEREAASASYWAGVARLSAAGRDLLNQQLWWLVDGDELRNFLEVPDALAGAWLRDFWGERDAARLLPPGSALTDHLEMWALAHRLFRVETPWDRGATRGILLQLGFWGAPCTGFAYNPDPPLRLPRAPALAGDPRREEPVLTSAGSLLLRAGRPVAILHAADSGGGPAAEQLRAVLRTTSWSTLWLYPSESGYLLFLFPDESRAAPREAPFEGRLSVGEATPAWMALARVLEPRFRGKEAKAVDHAAMLRCERELRRARPISTTVPGRDAPPPDAIVDPWNAVMDARAFGHGGLAQPLIMLSYAIPTPRLDPQGTAATAPMILTIRVQAEAYRNGDGVRIARDTTLVTRIGPTLRDHGFVTGTLQIPVGAGRWDVAMRLSQVAGPRASGSFMRRGGLEIGEGPGLAMSDLLAGHVTLPEAANPLGSLGLNFLEEWPQGVSALLRYQVLGVAAGQDYVVTTEVIPTEEWPKAAITMVDTVTSGGPVESRLTVVRLEGLAPGSHWFAVTVTAGEEEVTRYREFLVVKR